MTGSKWKEIDNCPKCGVTLIGEPIQDEVRATGSYGDSTHWRRQIAIYSRERDRTVAYQCPDCGHEWSAQDHFKEQP